MAELRCECRDAYAQGFASGYRMGYMEGKKDGILGVERPYAPESVLGLPIQTMDLPARAHNCLIRAGCKYIGDVAAMKDAQIRVMRNLGKVSANDIAQALLGRGICNTDWNGYLLENNEKLVEKLQCPEGAADL